MQEKMKCESKKTYSSKDYADLIAKKIFEQKSVKRYSYFCHKCNKFHLTSMSEQKFNHVINKQKEYRVALLADEWELKLKV